ncbi:hypothetical protein [Burkholderia vietnamiensis]|nr:hypothetical protein [Burkholderia vietnamiensis]
MFSFPNRLAIVASIRRTAQCPKKIEGRDIARLAINGPRDLAHLANKRMS